MLQMPEFTPTGHELSARDQFSTLLTGMAIPLLPVLLTVENIPFVHEQCIHQRHFADRASVPRRSVETSNMKI